MPDVGEVLRSMGMPWPEANESDLYEAARAWFQLEGALGDSCARASSAAESLTSNNEGPAVDAFEKYWEKYGKRGKGTLPLAAEACHAMGVACSKYGDEVAEAKQRIEEALAGAGAALVAGTVGAFFTFGLSEGAADAGAAVILDIAEGVITWLGEQAAAFAAELSAGAVAEAITSATLSIGASLVTEGAASALGAGAVATINGAISGTSGAVLSSIAENQVRELYGDKPLSDSEVASALATSALSGGIGGAVGKLASLSQAQLANMLENVGNDMASSDMQLSIQMVQLSREVRGALGKIGSDVLTKAATQLITAQQINSDKIVQGEIPKLIKRAAIRDDG